MADHGGTRFDDCFVQGGAMGRAMRAFDWAATPLGPVDGWPQSLRASVGVMLRSRFAMWMAWGPELTFFCNDAYRPTLGVKQAWALGSPAKKVWAEIWPDISPRIEAVLSTGEATWDEGLQLFLERSGYVEETYHTFSYSPLANDQGTVEGMLCVVAEETQRVVGERRLRTLRDLAARVIEATTREEACRTAAQTMSHNPIDLPFGAFYLLDDPQVARLCEATGLAPDTVITPKSVSVERPQGVIAEAFAHACLSGEATLVDLAGLHSPPAGSWQEPPQRAYVLPIARRGEGAPAGLLMAGVNTRRELDDNYRTFFGLVADQVSTAVANATASEEDRKRLEAMAELDRAKTVFFSNVSHEFRTPLTLMLGPLEDAIPEEQQPAQRERLTLVHRNALRLQKLVNTLLDFSRIEAGRIEAAFEPIELGALTAELASVFRSAIEAANLEFKVDCAHLEDLYVDRDMWEKIVLNLISNAFKFTFAGQISVSLSDDGDAALLTVADTGAGISAAELPHVFDRFHRVPGAKSRTHEGTGIGLALVQELVRLHGGSVSVASEPGQGSEFRVRIPKGFAHLPADRLEGGRSLSSTSLSAAAVLDETLGWSAGENAELRPAAEAEGDRPLVLVADDNADMRSYLTRILAPHFQVITVADGATALTQIRRRRPALVLTDVMMPELDGFGLVKEIRESAELSALPVIMLSARAGEEARIEGLDAGADDYLTKPFSAREVVARIEANLKLSAVRRDAAEREGVLREEARHVAERAATILESTSDGFLSFDDQWRFVSVNRAAEEFLGSLRGELLGRVLWETYPPILGTGIEREYRSVAELRRPATFESYYEPWDRWFELRAQPNDDGGVSVFFQDVTARKQFEEERESLLAAERSARALAEREGRIKDEFLATLSHELRTPLNAVLGYSSLLRMSKSDEAQVQEAAETIERNARAQAQLIEDLLDMNRIVSGKLRLDVQQLELPPIIQAALETVRPSAEAKGIRVQVLMDPLAGPVRGDANRLQQVIWNLLANAIKFTSKEGKVQVALERVNSHLEVSVADTGIGIEPEFLPRVFDRFRQADPSTTRQFGGLGLGLSIVKHLVELHGGSVRAKSPGAGFGATFVVALPLAVVHPEELAHERVHPRTSPGLMAPFRPDLKGVRVLAVDDDADAGSLIKRILADCGAEVVVAQSAAAAFEHFQTANFHVLVSDIGMPGEDGYSLIRKIRAWERERSGPPVPAMALTAFARSEDRQRAALAGFQMHLAKPVEPAELLALVANLAGRTDCA